mgnify:CR=1 FL=1
MTRLNKTTRFTPLRIQDLTNDQSIKLITATELLMGVFSELGWDQSTTYIMLQKLHGHVKTWKDQGGPNQ